VRQLRGFYRHALTYLTVNAGLAVLNFTTHPERIWVQWMLFGWGIGLQSHALSVFAFRGVPGRDWEERKAREYLSKRQSGGS
jgi:hypothetical protein